MRNLTIFTFFAALPLVLFWGFLDQANAEITPFPLPPFNNQNSEDWINSDPVAIKDLEGHVILIDVWTFSCWNCYRSFPWLNKLENSLEGTQFKIIGIHSPEFEHEKSRTSVRKKALEFGLHHPILIDNDFNYWRALNNKYWPTFYLVDKKGMVRYKFIGETHSNTRKSKAIKEAIQDLLSE